MDESLNTASTNESNLALKCKSSKGRWSVVRYLLSSTIEKWKRAQMGGMLYVTSYD